MRVKMSDMVGGGGGHEFVSHLHTHSENIKEIYVSAGDFVDSLQIVFENALGQPDALGKVGGNGGRHFLFSLDEDEHLTIDNMNKELSKVVDGGGNWDAVKL